jgi:hypothetical protein
LEKWIAAWDDLIDFEVVRVIPSEDAARRFEASVGTRPATD